MLTRLRRSEDGTMAVELGLVAPVLVFIAFGMIELTDAITAKRRVNLAASMIGDLITNTPNDYIHKSDVRDVLTMGGRVLEPYGIADTTIRVTVVTYDEDDDEYQVVWSRERKPNGNTRMTPGDAYKKGAAFAGVSVAGIHLGTDERLIDEDQHLVVTEIDYPFVSSLSNVIYRDGVEIRGVELRVPRQTATIAFCQSNQSNPPGADCTDGRDWLESENRPES